MSYETLVVIAKVFGPIWMMGILLIVLIRTYNPRRRASYDRIARSVLLDEEARPDER